MTVRWFFCGCQRAALYSQGLLSGEREEEVDDVGGEGLEEEDDECVAEPVGPAGAVGVPQDHLVGVSPDDLLGHADDLGPGNPLRLVGRDIVDRGTRGLLSPAAQKTRHCKDT